MDFWSLLITQTHGYTPTFDEFPDKCEELSNAHVYCVLHWLCRSSAGFEAALSRFPFGALRLGAEQYLALVQSKVESWKEFANSRGIVESGFRCPSLEPIPDSRAAQIEMLQRDVPWCPREILDRILDDKKSEVGGRFPLVKEAAFPVGFEEEAPITRLCRCIEAALFMEAIDIKNIREYTQRAVDQLRPITS